MLPAPMASRSTYGPSTRPWVLPLRMRSAWKAVSVPWSTRYSARAGASARGLRLEELADDLVELAAVDQAAAAQVVNEGFAGSQIGVRHGSNPPSSRGALTGRPRDEVLRTGHHAGWVQTRPGGADGEREGTAGVRHRKGSSPNVPVKLKMPIIPEIAGIPPACAAAA